MLEGRGYAAVATPAVAKPTPDGHDRAEQGKGWYARNKELVWSLTAAGLLAAALAGGRWLGLPRGVVIAVYLASYAFGGFDLVRHWVTSLRRGKFTFDIRVAAQ